MTGAKQQLALAVGRNLFADALASVLSADDVDEVIDLTDEPGAPCHFATALVAPGEAEPEADVIIVLPPSGVGEVAVTRNGVRELVLVSSVDALFDLLDAYSPADRPRRRPLA